MDEIINFAKIEKKWQDKWEKEKVFQVNEDSKKKKCYVLEMYPYPSGSGLHMGHAFNYTIGDILARFMIMKGFNVLHPMGFDSFGLPAENAAIKFQSHPRVFTDKAIENFIRQQKALGLSYDWTRKLQSHDIEFYRWNQYFFIKLFEKGLVYRKKSPVNYCVKCNTVLANEQVVDGKCWRHTDTEVEVRNLEQWFIKTTEYSEELLSEIEKLDWPERIKSMQRNWIGKSEGAEVIFKINDKDWKVFTTRPDTLFGVSFLVVSAQHPELMNLVSKEQKKEVEQFVKKIRSTKQEDMDKLDKEGVFTGSYAIHPLTGGKVPVWTGNFVLADYGSGIVMAVPAHDQRDFEFAKKYDLPIKLVIQDKEKKISLDNMKNAFVEKGFLINSEKFDGLENENAKEEIVRELSKKKLGKMTINYKFRDWLVSRQRYWGTPIPMIYCDECGIVPVPEKDLPIKLPEDVKFGEGNPLEKNSNFLKVECPKCGGKAKRETDTMDTFFDSSWYYLRFTDSQNKKQPFEKKKVEYWMPVDFYTGGAEHACMHLIYARFFTKALRDMGLLNFGEPFTKLFNQGMIHGEDGYVMSKSRGNVVDPLEVSKKYGADVLRFYLVSVAGPDKDMIWSTQGLDGSLRFFMKFYNYLNNVKIGKSDERTQHKINKSIREITDHIENVKYNFATIELRRLFDSLGNQISKSDLEVLIKLISPIMPHIAEEMWEKIGNKGFVSLAEWPEVDESKINEKFDKIEQALEKTVSDVQNILKIIKEKQGKEGKKVYLYVIPNELEFYDKKELESRLNVKVEVFAVNDKDKYDPENKAAKAKPGKPAIYVL